MSQILLFFHLEPFPRWRQVKFALGESPASLPTLPVQYGWMPNQTHTCMHMFADNKTESFSMHKMFNNHLNGNLVAVNCGNRWQFNTIVYLPEQINPSMLSPSHFITHWASRRRFMSPVLAWNLTLHSGTIDFVLSYSLILFKIKPAH